jgi:hypothetical protein
MKKIELILIILAVISLAAIYLNSNISVDKKYCSSDQDCSCGVNIKTGDCFYGNKNFVDITKQCPDFCNGIAGNLEIKCLNSTCVQRRVP